MKKTKQGLPIVKLVPIEKKRKPLFGRMRDTVHIKGDIINPIREKWDVS